MPGYQQSLILFALAIVVTYAAVTINSFDDLAKIGPAGSGSTIYDHHVELWASVTDCPKTVCKCEVQTDGIEDPPLSLKFWTEIEDLGSVTISKLRPYTQYTFTLACKDALSTATKKLNITTDYDRPLAPQNITGQLISNRHLQVTWSSPSIPIDSFSYYRITIDKHTFVDIPKSETTHTMSEEYEDGVKHKITVVTCYINNQKGTSCSDSAGTELSFFIPVTPTIATTAATAATAATTATTVVTVTTATTTESTGVHSYSTSISIIIFSLFLISNMN